MSKNQEAQNNNLSNIYYNPSDPGSYGGVERLLSRAKELRVPSVTRKDVRRFLSSQPTYTLHRSARRHFPRNKTYVRGIDEQWQADLVDMQALSHSNKGYKYLLTCIDVFSKFAWAVPVKTKSAASIVDGFKILFEQETKRRPKTLQTDKGKEFLNAAVQHLLQKTYKIRHFTSWSDQKAAVVERFNRTLKERMWRYFTNEQTQYYLDVLPNLLKSYNNSPHRSIGVTPSTVKKANESKIRERLYKEHGQSKQSNPSPDLSIGTLVRISKVKGDFEKGYIPNWSEEDFRIREIDDSKGVRRVYRLEDKMGEAIQGMWYREELIPITRNRYLIEKILRRRTTATGENECLIHWRGWPKKFNSWILEKDIPSEKGPLK